MGTDCSQEPHKLPLSESHVELYHCSVQLPLGCVPMETGTFKYISLCYNCVCIQFGSLVHCGKVSHSTESVWRVAQSAVSEQGSREGHSMCCMNIIATIGKEPVVKYVQHYKA